MWPNYPVTEHVGTAFKFKERMKNLPSRYALVLPEFGHFTLSFGRVRRGNVSKFKTHMQGLCSLIKSYCFITLSLPSPC